jgi:hypothetical protein
MLIDQFVGTNGLRGERWKDRVVTPLKHVLLESLDDISNVIAGHVSEHAPPSSSR